MPPRLDYTAFDADNHYYEALDAFTRHMDPRLAKRAVQWAVIDGRPRLLVAEKINRFIPNPTFDPVAKAGCLDAFFRGENPEGLDIRAAFGELEPIRPAYRDREARLALMDQQGIQGCLLFPTLGVGIEHPLRHDADLTHATLHAFNQWLDEAWCFAWRERIFAAPLLSLMDVQQAVAELEWVLARDARVVHLRAAPVPGPKRRSLGDPSFDPFWARVNEAGITVVVHAGDSGYTTHGYVRDGFSAEFGGAFAPSIKHFNIERAAYDFLITLAYERLFERFPALRIASVENGSD